MIWKIVHLASLHFCLPGPLVKTFRTVLDKLDRGDDNNLSPDAFRKRLIQHKTKKLAGTGLSLEQQC